MHAALAWGDSEQVRDLGSQLWVQTLGMEQARVYLCRPILSPGAFHFQKTNILFRTAFEMFSRRVIHLAKCSCPDTFNIFLFLSFFLCPVGGLGVGEMVQRSEVVAKQFLLSEEIELPSHSPIFSIGANASQSGQNQLTGSRQPCVKGFAGC